MNALTATGRLTDNAEVSTTATGRQRMHFRLAVLDNNKRDANSPFKPLFLDCYCWDRQAILMYMTKGKAITIQGRLISYEYVDKNGIEQKKIQVIVNEIEFLPSQTQENGATTAPQGQSGKTMPPKAQKPATARISHIPPQTQGEYSKNSGFIPSSPDDFDDGDVSF